MLSRELVMGIDEEGVKLRREYSRQECCMKGRKACAAV